MTGRTVARLAILRESAERIYDPATIDSRMSFLPGGQRGLLWKLYRASRSELTANELRVRRDVLKLYKQTAAEIQGDMAGAFAGLGVENWDLATARRFGRDQALFAQVRDRINALGGKVEDTVAEGLVAQYKRAYSDSAYRLDVLTPESVTVKFGMLPDAEIAAMMAEPWKGATFSERLGVINDEMAGTIRNTLVRSMMAGDSWAAAARRIRGEMGVGGQRSVWRAEMIARTELAHAQEVATAEFNEENEDVIADEVWVSHPGACEECIDKHGEPVSKVGRPPDDSHPNCVCDVLAVPKSWGKLASSGDGDFSIRPPSRRAWMDENMPGFQED